MARQTNRLTPRAVAAASRPGLYPDGLGLNLKVSAGGTKSWHFRFMLDGRARAMGLGPVHAITLAEARERAQHCRKLLTDRIDPIDARRDELKARAMRPEMPTFAKCVDAYIAAHESEWRNPKHRAQWLSTLTAYAGPVMGEMPVNEIELRHVLAVLEPIWRTTTETASRLRGRIESVLDWATVRGHREGLNPARWKGHLDHLLPAPGKARKVEHHRALPIDAMPDFMVRLREAAGMGARALEFAILAAARSGEVRGATWAEVDLDAAVWTVPAERMKMQREHRVPLPPAAVALLKALPRMAGCDFIFPSSRSGQLSDATLSSTLKRMNVDAVPHGFRSTFRDWCSERTNYPRDAAEMALAHAIGDKVEAAYRRGDLFEKRVAMMSEWADFIGKPAASVTPIAKARRKA